jgi:hypothetical protein
MGDSLRFPADHGTGKSGPSKMNEAFDARQATEMPLIRINTAHRAASRIGGPREKHMIGITLITDQIRNAPAEVQRWIEHLDRA